MRKKKLTRNVAFSADAKPTVDGSGKLGHKHCMSVIHLFINKEINKYEYLFRRRGKLHLIFEFIRANINWLQLKQRCRASTFGKHKSAIVKI